MMPTTPLAAIDLAILLGVPVLVVRLVVGLSRPRRISRFWTFALPTVALLGFILRVSITRNLEDVIPSDDWISASSWWAVVVTQAIATTYQWIPDILYERWFRRHGLDPRVLVGRRERVVGRREGIATRREDVVTQREECLDRHAIDPDANPTSRLE